MDSPTRNPPNVASKIRDCPRIAFLPVSKWDGAAGFSAFRPIGGGGQQPASRSRPDVFTSRAPATRCRVFTFGEFFL